MSTLLESSLCASCGQPLQLGEKVVPVWVVTHKGRVYTEVEPIRQVTHVTCPFKRRERNERNG